MLTRQVLADVPGELLAQPASGDACEGADEAGQGDPGRVVHEQVHVIGFAVELAEFRAEVRADLPHDLLAAGQDLPGERAAPVLQIAAYRWDPAGEPRSAVQLTHGMGEHAQRYDHVARTLNEAGFVVYAQDHRVTAQAPILTRSATWARTAGRAWSTTSGCSARISARSTRACRS